MMNTNDIMKIVKCKIFSIFIMEGRKFDNNSSSTTNGSVPALYVPYFLGHQDIFIL